MTLRRFSFAATRNMTPAAEIVADIGNKTGRLFLSKCDRLPISNSCRVRRRIANVGEIHRVFRNALCRVGPVGRRTSPGGFRADVGPGGEDQRVVDRGLGVASFDLVLAFLQHRRLK